MNARALDERPEQDETDRPAAWPDWGSMMTPVHVPDPETLSRPLRPDDFPPPSINAAPADPVQYRRLVDVSTGDLLGPADDAQIVAWDTRHKPLNVAGRMVYVDRPPARAVPIAAGTFEETVLEAQDRILKWLAKYYPAILKEALASNPVP